MMRAVARMMVATCLLAAPAFAGARGGQAGFAEARERAFAEADADGSGTLTAEEFAVFQELVRRHAKAKTFARLDADGDGVLSAEELAAFKARRGPGGRAHCPGR